LQVFKFYLSNVYKYLFLQVNFFNFIYLESFSENVNLIKQKHYSESINMIILKFIINIQNYQLNVYYNYNDNQLYIYNIYRYYIFKFIIYVKILM